jgi:hypothetical protein
MIASTAVAHDLPGIVPDLHAYFWLKTRIQVVMKLLQGASPGPFNAQLESSAF